MAGKCRRTISQAYHAWYRFNIPDAGSITTIAENSTVETRLTPIYPDHGLKTTYAYSTNQVTTQKSPDGGTNRFWYDLLSRLRISQNDKQNPNNDYSYTDYDNLGRIVEVGQTHNYAGTLIGQPDYVPEINFYLFHGFNATSQITHTYYDESVVHTSTNGIATVPTQHNLRKRVAASTYAEVMGSPVKQATYYDYDLDGNVKTLYQQIDGLYKQPADTGLKKIDYQYDLISGKVNFVAYQQGKTDHFYYKYNYDADNRLTDAWTGKSAVIDSAMGSDIVPDLKKLEAHYAYYLHGPLARTETGDQYGKVQGTDFAYTLQGWIKGVNGNSLNPNNEMGKDGRGNNPIARDAYAYTLGYYNGDYKPLVDTTTAFSIQYQSAGGDITGQSLYNGNISNRTIAISNVKSGETVGYTYRYDQLNRIKQARQHTGINGIWNSGSIINAYAESFKYDGNGNLLNQIRNGADTTGMPLDMDNLTYAHNYDSNGKLIDNKLRHIKDAVSSGNYSNDLDNQPDNNYTYDAIGNRTSDYNAGITNIGWTVYGKIDSITKSGSNIKYRYNTAGQRTVKTVGSLSTYYMRDAQGNTLALYTDSASTGQKWKEQHLYGDDHIGIWTPGDWGIIGNRQYELTDSRGNVVVTVTDKRIQTGSVTVVDHYNADVATASDTYSFGFEQPNRQYGAAQKYGYNGKENDNEIASENYGMREYDKMGSVFWSVDPISPQYPWYTPYQFSGNNPIQFIDIDGLEEAHPKHQEDPITIFLEDLSIRVVKAAKHLQAFMHRDAVNDINQVLELALRNPDKFIKHIDKSVTKQIANARKDGLKELNYIATGQTTKAAKLASKMTMDYGAVLLGPEVMEFGEFTAEIKEGSTILNEIGIERLNNYNFSRAYKPVTFEGQQIPASANGLSPEFRNTRFLYNAVEGQNSVVKIKLTGKYFGADGDFAAANVAGGFKKTPTGYTWHHLDDFDPVTGTSTIELIRKDAHKATLSHTGSVKQYELYNNSEYKIK